MAHISQNTLRNPRHHGLTVDIQEMWERNEIRIRVSDPSGRHHEWQLDRFDGLLRGLKPQEVAERFCDLFLKKMNNWDRALHEKALHDDRTFREQYLQQPVMAQEFDYYEWVNPNTGIVERRPTRAYTQSDQDERKAKEAEAQQRLMAQMEEAKIKAAREQLAKQQAEYEAHAREMKQKREQQELEQLELDAIREEDQSWGEFG